MYLLMRNNQNGRYHLKFDLLRHKFIAYILSFKILGWITGMVFFLIGEWYAVQNFLLTSSIMVLFGSLCIAFSSALINNIFDKTLDIFSRRPEKMMIFQYISSKEMMINGFILSLIGLVIFLFIDLTVFIIGLVIMILSLLYSAPPVKLKIHPPFDCITNALILGPLPFFLGWSTTKKIFTMTSIFYGIDSFLFILAFILIYTSLDIETDKKFGITTSCTKIGFTKSKILAIILFIISIIFAVFLLNLKTPFTLSILVTFPFFLLILKKTHHYQSDFAFVGYIIFIEYLIWMVIILFFLLISTLSILPILMLFIIFIWAYYQIMYIRKLYGHMLH